MTQMYMRGRVYYGTAAEMMDRIDELETKLAKAVSALQSAEESIVTFMGVHGYGQDSGAWIVLEEVRTNLAELTGGKDD